MIIQVLDCPNGQSTDSVRPGKTCQGTQRYRAQDGAGRTCLRAYASAGPSPAVTQQRVDMAMHARGIQDTARVLPSRPHTALAACKKRQRCFSKCTTRGGKGCLPSPSQERGAAQRSWTTVAD
jgi:transposase-like protein